MLSFCVCGQILNKMAVARPIPTCSYCGKSTAKGIYKDESLVPHFMRLIGDTFIRWEHKECNCKGAKKARKELKIAMDKWHKEHPFDLQKILDSKGAKGKQNGA